MGASQKPVESINPGPYLPFRRCWVIMYAAEFVNYAVVSVLLKVECMLYFQKICQSGKVPKYFSKFTQKFKQTNKVLCYIDIIYVKLHGYDLHMNYDISIATIYLILSNKFVSSRR